MGITIDSGETVGYIIIVGRLFCPWVLADRLVIIVVVVLLIGMADAAVVVASTIGSNFSVVMLAAFKKILGIYEDGNSVYWVFLLSSHCTYGWV